jgi:hypothetical protein
MKAKMSLIFTGLILLFFGERLFVNLVGAFSSKIPYSDEIVISDAISIANEVPFEEFSFSDMNMEKTHPWEYQQILFQLWPRKMNPSAKLKFGINDSTPLPKECAWLSKRKEVSLARCE